MLEHVARARAAASRVLTGTEDRAEPGGGEHGRPPARSSSGRGTPPGRRGSTPRARSPCASRVDGAVELGVRRRRAVLHERRLVRGHPGPAAGHDPRPWSLIASAPRPAAGPTASPSRSLRREQLAQRPVASRRVRRAPGRRAPRRPRRRAGRTSSGVSSGVPEVGPPLDHRRAEVLEHVREAAGSAGEVLGRDRAQQRPAQARARRDREVEVGDRDRRPRRPGGRPRATARPAAGWRRGRAARARTRTGRLPRCRISGHRRPRPPPRRSAARRRPRPAAPGAAG